MRNNFLTFVFICLIHITVTSCGDGIESFNVNRNALEIDPNNPQVTYIPGLFANATKDFVLVSRGNPSFGITSIWMQYWASLSYEDQDRFLQKDAVVENIYRQSYFIANNLKSIIDTNTKTGISAHGNNGNQIAACRIMLSYIFYDLTNFFGDVPYYSYGSQNDSFQALAVDDGIFLPVFASQQDIYEDILKELRESADMIDTSERVFTSGDNIFQGDATKWKKFANSLILRVATNINKVDRAKANTAINAAIADGVMTSNEDNAGQRYGRTRNEASPVSRRFIGRASFAVAAPFVELLKGERGNFPRDPRLFQMVAPTTATVRAITTNTYPRSTNINDYIGIPYAFPLVDRISASTNTYSLPSNEVVKQDHKEVLMEYAEVAFILSEHNGFDQVNYEKGVRASMEKWGVREADINTYIAALPPANEENVLTQKYIALYMQSHQAYSDYRRTGFPKTLIKPNETVTIASSAQVGVLPPPRNNTYTFEPAVPVSDIPFRLRYPSDLQTINKTNRDAAARKLSNGDVITSKLFWDVNN